MLLTLFPFFPPTSGCVDVGCGIGQKVAMKPLVLLVLAIVCCCLLSDNGVEARPKAPRGLLYYHDVRRPYGESIEVNLIFNNTLLEVYNYETYLTKDGR